MAESTSTGASVFRTASPATTDAPSAPVKAGDPSGTATTSVSDLFATYEGDQKKPYTAEYFEVSDIWDKEPTLARDLKEIEGYVRSQVENKKVDNSTKAAKEFLKEIERKAGLSRYESQPQRIQKILAYIDFKKVVDS